MFSVAPVAPRLWWHDTSWRPWVSWQGVRGSEERLDASDPQKPPPMNYSATSTITFHFLTLLVSGPGRPLSLKGDEGESDRH